MSKEIKPNLILHIGTEKTGSKSIQKYLRNNATYLEGLGYYVPNIFGKFNHYLFPFAFYESFRNDTIVKDLGLAEDNDLFKSTQRDLLEQLESNCKKHNKYTWIITSELLSSRLTNLNEIKNLSKVLRKHFTKIKVILYLRDPVYFYISHIQEQIKWGHEDNLDFFSEQSIKKYIHHTNYKKLITNWQSRFKSDELVLRNYKTQSDFNVVSDFINLIKIKDTINTNYDFYENESLSYFAVKCLAFINKSIPSYINNKSNYKRKDLYKYFKISTGNFEKFNISSSEYKLIYSYFKESKIFLEENYKQINKFQYDEINKLKIDNKENEKNLTNFEISLLEIIQDMFNDMIALEKSLDENISLINNNKRLHWFVKKLNYKIDFLEKEKKLINKIKFNDQEKGRIIDYFKINKLKKFIKLILAKFN